jgi:hypothetical protein
MAKSPRRRRGHPDFRQRGPGPLRSVAEIAAELQAVLTPAWWAPRPLERREPRHPARRMRRRARLVTLPVMGAWGVRLVGRRWGALAEVPRGVAPAGRGWGSPVQRSEQASAKRRATLPARARAEVFPEVRRRRPAHPPAPLPGLESGAGGRAHFPRSARGEGATLAALRKKTQTLQAQPGRGRAGRRRGRGAAFPHRPLWQLSTAAAAAPDHRFAPELRAARPTGGRLLFALGCCRFLGVDDLPDQDTCGGPRRRPQTASRPPPLRSSSPSYREDLLEGGLPPAPPCRSPLRLVAVWWQGPW